MLVLSRKVGEEIMIGDSIRLVVVGVRGTQVRLGLEAPRDVAIHRREIHRRITDCGPSDMFPEEREDAIAEPASA